MMTLFTTLLSLGPMLEQNPVQQDPTPLTQLSECADSLDVAIFNSPRRAHLEQPLHILVAAEKDIPGGVVTAVDPSGRVMQLETKKVGGPPYGFVATVDKADLATGTWRFGIGASGRVDGCQEVKVRKRPWGNESRDADDPIWRTRIKWERDVENLYSLWIEVLFDHPVEEDISWNPLHDVIRDPSRNLLFDYLGMGEDSSRRKAPRLDPDCADFPYMLRAYFAWKLGLPFAYRGCTRGNAKRAPRCGDIMTNHQKNEEFANKIEAFEWFARRKIKGTVHSSTLRTGPEDEKSNFYPVKLDRRSLRPGTIYTDPYGHTLMIGKWFPQEGDKAGVLMAVDAQPDGTIGRRTFWKGSFLFPNDDAVKGAGWKRFRPVRFMSDGIRELTNDEIAASIDYGDFSTEQWDRGKDAFYERMDELISPNPIPPEKALLAVIDALDQQIRRRVESVENGEQWKRDNRGRVMKMPTGPAIFVTSGPWESYSTPSRDLRLLIAIDTVLDMPARVRRRPQRFVLPANADLDAIETQLRQRMKELAAQRTFTYQRSDGTSWTLTMADIMNRTVEFEMAYNPNDCIEIRWGAKPGSEEYKPCKDHAPSRHRKLMESYRPWFQERQRPLN